MGSEAKASNGGGFRSKIEHVLYSGEKKHVFAGIVIVGAIFSVPWFFMTRGNNKHQSHQDYMEKADKARNARLRSAPTPPSSSTQ
ncbi:uncharacterized protein LOC124920472 [Impatiens glandulifera]|uniref:uncharacterized protein LOC124920472 n=1 Tax=Impatiens glandulifera TaxID=253017 RepID=UPI001FB06ABB|nr:uncharacterized protein LOC124920472 [Impatiens glandulifera]